MVGDCACRGEVVLVHDEHELMVVVAVLDVEDIAGVGHHSGQGAELARCLLIQSHITTSQTATTGSPAAARAVRAVLGSLTRKCATPTPPWVNTPPPSRLTPAAPRASPKCGQRADPVR